MANLKQRLVKSKRTNFKKSTTSPKAAQPLKAAQYQAEDTIIFDAASNTLTLHGSSVVVYDNMQLQAATIALDLHAHTISAVGEKDSKTNKLTGTPIFTYIEENPTDLSKK